MYLYQRGHPSSRHSEVDWSDVDYEKYPLFNELKAHEVIMRPGDVIYIPMYWFHFIVNLNINWQCNSRSGFTDKYKREIAECGRF